MELKQVIETAQRHLDGENVALSDVLEAFKNFIVENTPVSHKSACIYERAVYDVWEAAENFGVIITDDEALEFLDNFFLGDGILGNIEDRFDGDFERKFRNASKGSLFEEAVKENNIERAEMMLEAYGKTIYDEFYFPGGYDPLEIAAKYNRKEIVEILLKYGAPVDNDVVEKTVNPDIRKKLEEVLRSSP